jgi:hypothetical protein
LNIYPIGFFHLDLAEVKGPKARSTSSWPSTGTSKLAVIELVEKADMRVAAAFLKALVGAVPYRIHTVLTTTESSSPICRRTVEGFRQDGVASLRSHLSLSWHRPPSDPTQPSLDQRTGRTKPRIK